MATNQTVLSAKAINTPLEIPSQVITSGTTRGNIKAPATGVIATKKRNLLKDCEF